ncbi:MAG: homocitrate synthase NifV [Clostridiales bacterium]|nr:homocitrate synthase NifV [Clostridiales bacterium]
MLQLTDATLCTLDLNKANVSDVKALYESLLWLGIDFIQIEEPVRQILGNQIIPKRTCLIVDSKSQFESAPGFGKYVARSYAEPFDTEIIAQSVFAGDFTSGMECPLYVFGDQALFLGRYESIFDTYRKRPQWVDFVPRYAGYAGTALAMEWIEGGGQGLVTGMLGLGGYAATEEVIMALNVRGKELVNMDTTRLRRIAKQCAKLIGQPIRAHKAIVGERIFHVESGVHVDGLLKNTHTYEAFPPESVGMTREFVIGKLSGKSALVQKLQELNVEMDSDAVDCLLKAIKSFSSKTGARIDEQNFLSLLNTVKGESKWQQRNVCI